MSARWLILLLFGLGAVWGTLHTATPLALGAGGLALIGDFLRAAVQPALWSDGHFLPTLAARAALQTAALAVASISLAVLGGALLAPLLSEAVTGRLGRGGGLVFGLGRVVAAGLRSVHELLWAILLLAAFGRSSTAAVLAIALPFAGMLARVYAELIDEADPSPSAALERIGASPVAALLLARLPQILPDAIAYSLYRFECALRSSAVLGFFGLPTLGYYIALAAENVAMRQLWTFLYALLALIVLTEAWSGAVRRRLVQP